MKKPTKNKVKVEVMEEPLTSLAIAQKLLEARKDMEEMKETYDAAKQPLEEEIDHLEEALIAQMKLERLSRTPTLPDGTAFNREVKTSIEVTDEKKAMEYAAQVNCLRIDKTKIASLVKREVNTPEGFALKETEFVKRVQVEVAEEVKEIE